MTTVSAQSLEQLQQENARLMALVGQQDSNLRPAPRASRLVHREYISLRRHTEESNTPCCVML